MLHRLIFFPAFVVLIGFAAQANATGFTFFGGKETIRFVANTGIKDMAGNNLYLGRRITMKSFILPYDLQDNGYVLAVAGTAPVQYSPLPTGQRLQSLQLNGMLPKPLPPFHFKFGDYLVGNALWWLLLLIILLPVFISKIRERREYSEDEEL